MNNFVDTVEEGIQNEILTAIDSTTALLLLRLKSAFSSINATSRRATASLTANSELGEDVGFIAFCENASGNNNVLQKSNLNDDARKCIPD